MPPQNGTPRYLDPPGSIRVGPIHAATPDGRIYSLYSGKFLSEGLGSNGRPGVVIRTFESDALKRRETHVLVCKAFHGPRPHGMEVSHLNGNILDNRASNLRWETKIKNLNRRFDHGTDDRGFKNSRASVTREQAQWIRNNPGGLTHQERANKIGVSRTTISRIVNRQRFAEEEE